MEQFLLKYVWSAAGMSMISMPVLLSESGLVSKLNEGNLDGAALISQRTEEFTMAKSLLSNSADAIERIMTSYKEVIELTGFTRRVYEMFQLFESVNRIGQIGQLPPIVTKPLDGLFQSDDAKPKSGMLAAFGTLGQEELQQSTGLVFESREHLSIVVESISVITPNGDIIVPCLSLKVLLNYFEYTILVFHNFQIRMFVDFRRTF